MQNHDISIIYVPGIRPKPPPKFHQAQLRRCLEGGLVQIGAGRDSAVAIAGTLNVVGWSHGFYGEHRDISPDLPGIAQLLRFEGSVEAHIRAARSPGRRIISWLYALADYFPVLGTHFSTRRMKTRVQEITRYFEDADGESSAARSMLKDALVSAWNSDKRVLLIGHSFGSVIAYDTLWELSREADSRDLIEATTLSRSLTAELRQVGLFMTMGSPLTMNFITHNLKGVDAEGLDRYPECISRWINLAAVGEVTALDRKLSHRFAEMLELGLVDSIEDDLNVVGRFRESHGLNVHKCYGYMASTEVCRLILEWTHAGEPQTGPIIPPDG